MTTELAQNTPPSKCWLFISIVHGLIGALILGYNLPLFNIDAETVRSCASKTYINDICWGIFNAMFPFGALFGALVSGRFADKFGRKSSILLMAVIHIISSLIVATSYIYVQLLIGRFITGIGSGMATVICGTYIKEISPIEYRGRFGSLFQISITFMICVSMMLGKLFQTDPIWRYGAAFPGMLSLIQLFLSSTILESPEWLRQNDRENEANEIEHKLWTKNSYEYAGAMDKMDIDNFTEKEGTAENKKKSLSYKQILFDSCFLHFFYQMTGINAVMYYSGYILSDTEVIEGLDAWLGSVYISIANFLSSLVVLCFVHKYGRKPLLIISLMGMCVASVVITFMFRLENDIGVIVCLICFVVSFEFGLGSIPFFYVAELSPIEYRGDMMSYSNTMNWSINTVIALVTPVLINELDQLTFVPFAVVAFIGALFVFVVLPETKHCD